MKHERGSQEHQAFLERRRVYQRERRASMPADQLAKERECRLDWHRRNRDSQCERMRAWRAANPTASIESSAAWRCTNRDRQLELSRAWKDANPARLAEYAAANIERKRELNRLWAKQNPDKLRVKAAIRRARKLGAGGTHTQADVASLYVKQRGKCVVCRGRLGDEFHVDHVTPLAKGGSNDRLNLQLLCPDCNLRKGAKDPLKFMQEKGFLL